MYRLLSRFIPAVVVLSALPLAVLTGCGASTTFSTPTAAGAFKGKIYGGQQPVNGATVSLWAVGTTGYGSGSLTPLATTTSAADGSFALDDTAVVCTAGEQVYITAAGGQSTPGLDNPNIMLAAGLGDCTAAESATVEINEVSTAVTAFALAQFFTPTLGSTSTDSFGTDLADITAFTNSNQYLIPTLIDVPSGMVNPNTSVITIEADKIYSIANTLASCVNDGVGFANCNTLFTDTTDNKRGATTPTDTLQAAVQMARFPYRNVKGLYTLATKQPPFVGGMLPNDWTIGVSYTSSDYSLSIAGTATSGTSASIDIDAAGKVWFPTNKKSHTGVGYFDPTATAFTGPYINISNFLTQPQYVALDNNGRIYVTDAASPNYAFINAGGPTDDTSSFGSISLPGLSSGPISSDASGLVSSTYVAAGGVAKLIQLTQTTYNIYNAFTASPTGITANPLAVLASTSGSSTVCNIEGADQTASMVLVSTASTCISGGIAFASGTGAVVSAATSVNEICTVDEADTTTSCLPYSLGELNLPEGVATDGAGAEWTANSGSGSVFTFGGLASSFAETSRVPYLHDASDGNTMTTPYAIAIDGSGNVWVANAGCVKNSNAACSDSPFVLSEVIGAAAPTITPLAAQMAGNGFLVGTPPGTIVPTSDVAARPNFMGSTTRANNSSTPHSSSGPTPVVIHKN